MKHWKCADCSRTHESEDNIKFVVCKTCLVNMKPSSYIFEREVEIEYMKPKEFLNKEGDNGKQD